MSGLLPQRTVRVIRPSYLSAGPKGSGHLAFAFCTYDDCVLWNGTRFVRRTAESLPGLRIANIRCLDSILVKAALSEKKLEEVRTPGGAPDGAKLEAFFATNAESVKAACGVRDPETRAGASSETDDCVGRSACGLLG